MTLTVKAVMFDLDGTLLHTAPEIAKAANLMLTDLNLPALAFEQVRDYIGKGVQTLIKRCLHSAEDKNVVFKQAETLFYQHYTSLVGDSEPFAGVVTGLKMLVGKGFKLACVTNKPEKFTVPLLEKSGLAQYFTQVVSGDSLAKNKPDPMQLLHVCAKFNVPVTQALMVGDSEVDIQAAKAAGCYVVTVPYGYNQGKVLDTSNVDATIASFAELPALLS